MNDEKKVDEVKVSENVDCQEFGKCEVCGKEGLLQRTTYHYDVKCECHGPNHFEMIRHCATCKPKEPVYTSIQVKTSTLQRVWQGEACGNTAVEVNANKIVERIMKPTIGRIVIYKTTSEDRRFMRNMDCNERDELPAIIVSVHDETYVNLHVFVDGLTTLWRKSIVNGTADGCWHWPVIGK